MIIQKITKNNVDQIISQTTEVLNRGGLVIFPSDTVYGLLVDASNEGAVRKLIAFKNRPPGKAISVFISDLTMLKKFVLTNDKQLKTIQELIPGPYTVVLNSKHKVSKLLESEKGSLGIRIPDNVFINKLTKKYGRPITATSANLTGRSVHYSINSLIKDLTKQKEQLIDLVVDTGKLPRNKPSTVIDLSGEKIKILRQGDISFNDKIGYLSNSSEKTEKIGQSIFEKFASDERTKPLVFVIEGELGVGKTILIKGIGKCLGIDNIVSPSFVIYYEYDSKKTSFKKLIHFDLYHLQDEEELKYLRINEYLKKENLLCFEWGEKMGNFFDYLKNVATIIYIKMEYVNEKKRKLTVIKTYNNRYTKQ